MKVTAYVTNRSQDQYQLNRSDDNYRHLRPSVFRIEPFHTCNLAFQVI